MQMTEAAATSVFATRWASRKTPSKENAATANIAVRVTIGVKPKTFQAKARYAITAGGWALEGVECGIRLPVSSRSRAAGT